VKTLVETSLITGRHFRAICNGEAVGQDLVYGAVPPAVGVHCFGDTWQKCLQRQRAQNPRKKRHRYGRCERTALTCGKDCKKESGGGGGGVVPTMGKKSKTAAKRARED
jgi:hypothetical protein